MEMVKLLTENGARLNDATQYNDTVLTKALDMENFDVVKYFVACGADVNQANKKGLTPLLIAESNNDFQTFQYLVDCGAKMTEETQATSPKLARYYRKAKESSLRRGKTSQDFGSNQEEAED
ncbi:putative ankyrin repeat domain-containing protein 30B-like [Zophobas morio]|uniref:putative ankyrin repeat domain-containing protein 30B-like n=1 Tax=Zophobas morio TaxID=2755281 RepID=UPI003083C599